MEFALSFEPADKRKTQKRKLKRSLLKNRYPIIKKPQNKFSWWVNAFKNSTKTTGAKAIRPRYII